MQTLVQQRITREQCSAKQRNLVNVSVVVKPKIVLSYEKVNNN